VQFCNTESSQDVPSRATAALYSPHRDHRAPTPPQRSTGGGGRRKIFPPPPPACQCAPGAILTAVQIDGSKTTPPHNSVPQRLHPVLCEPTPFHPCRLPRKWYQKRPASRCGKAGCMRCGRGVTWPERSGGRRCGSFCKRSPTSSCFVLLPIQSHLGSHSLPLLASADVSSMSCATSDAWPAPIRLCPLPDGTQPFPVLLCCS
jgi:hypothetical protein